jgi:hypothetical protein
MEPEMKATEEQIGYAVWLDKGMKLGLVMLTVTFVVYLAGILEPHLPVDKLPEYWGMSVHKYLEHARVHAGWAWVRMLHRGDFLNFVGIAFLAGITILCYLRIIPVFLRKRDRVYAIIGILEVLVLTLAASGLLKSGGH